MVNGPRFEKLFQPGRIGTLEVKNRLVMPPMATNLGTDDGYVTEQVRGYYEARARGGVGLIITEICCIDFPKGKSASRELGFDDDRFLPGMLDVVDSIHQYGAKAAIQLHHAGREAVSGFTGHQPVAPSPSTFPWLEPPQALTIQEIKDLIARFAEAAERGKKAGFDGVEIHGAHGYLIAQFLSPAANQRQDEYGGSLQNRARFLIETLKASRKAVGKAFPLWCRINGQEYMENGLTVQEATQIARMAQEAGADAIHVSTFGAGAYAHVTTPHPSEPGRNVHLAEAVKKATSLPVITVGRIEPELGERILQEGKADFIGMGRAIIADPEFPNKLASGNIDDIRPCIGCLECLDRIIFRHQELRCMVNAAVGREKAYRLSPSGKKRRVMVVGGGPAGMEAARVSALRGHLVTLYEKDEKLGGQLTLASRPPLKSHLEKLTHYLETQVRKAGISIETGKEVTPALIDAVKPEAIILASGITPFIPEIPGMENTRTIIAEDVLSEKASVGEKVVVIGGGMVGCEVASLLMEKDRKVTVLEMAKRMASGMMPIWRAKLLESLREKGVKLLTEITIQAMSSGGITFVKKGGETQTIDADTIVIAVGSKPNTELFNALEGKVKDIRTAGDCIKPRRIGEAIDEGYLAGMAV